MEKIFLELLTPEIATIIKPKNKKLISYGNFFNVDFVYRLLWIYKYYFEESTILFLPKSINIESTLCEFNKLVGDFILTQEDICYASLESIDLEAKVVIYGFGDIIFNELTILNKKRINTRIKTSKAKIHVVSYTPLKILDLVAFDQFECFQMGKFPEFTINGIDLLDNDEETYDQNVESFVDFICENKDQSIYISLELPVAKILQIEKLLKQNDIDVSRKENKRIVLNSQKIIQRSFLTNSYDIYIFITQPFDYPLDIVHYLKESYGKQIYFDSSHLKTTNRCLKRINFQQTPERIHIKDSNEFENYQELVKQMECDEPNMASESYYTFEASEAIKRLDLQNLTKRDYDIIRHFVKVKLSGKFDLDIKTCQLSVPCSPKDRSKKLNSLSNKISSYDYRCDVTCELFKNFQIGVVVWSEVFANRKSPVALVKNNTYVYQTTSGTWKYTTVLTENV
jgi:hypothetical protein